MKIRQKDGEVAFYPENDNDIFLLGAMSVHVSGFRYDFKRTEPSIGMDEETNEIEKFRIPDDELITLITKSVYNLNVTK